MYQKRIARQSRFLKKWSGREVQGIIFGVCDEKAG